MAFAECARRSNKCKFYAFIRYWSGLGRDPDAASTLKVQISALASGIIYFTIHAHLLGTIFYLFSGVESAPLLEPVTHTLPTAALGVFVVTQVQSSSEQGKWFVAQITEVDTVKSENKVKCMQVKTR